MLAILYRYRLWALWPLLLSAGCATTSSTSGVDPRLSNSNSAEFFSRSGYEACAAGAALTMLLACLNADNKVSCGAIAATVGCGVGMGANYYLDTLRAEYANTEDRLDKEIADVQKDNMALQDLTRTARGVINDDQQSLRRIHADIVRNQLRRDAARRRLAEIDRNTAFLRQQLANARAKHAEWQKVAAQEAAQGQSARLDVLNGEISRMRSQISGLEAEIDQLYRQRSAIRLG